MPEPKLFVGSDPVVATGTVLLGPDDESFYIQIYDLTFSFHFVHDNARPPVKTEPAGGQRMDVTLNTWQTPAPTFKVKVGFIWGNDLFLAVRLEPHQNYRTLTYTFSTRGR